MTSSVTPTKWKGPDGRVWERTGEKRTPEPGELHWCDASQPEPYPFTWPPRTSWGPRQDWPAPGFQCSDPHGTMQVAGDPPRVISNYAPPENRPCVNCGEPIGLHLMKSDDTPLLCPRAPHVCAIWKLSAEQAWEPPAPPNTSYGDEIDHLAARVEIDENYGKLYVLAMLQQARQLQRVADYLLELTETKGR